MFSFFKNSRVVRCDALGEQTVSVRPMHLDAGQKPAADLLRQDRCIKVVCDAPAIFDALGVSPAPFDVRTYRHQHAKFEDTYVFWIRCGSGRRPFFELTAQCPELNWSDWCGGVFLVDRKAAEEAGYGSRFADVLAALKARYDGTVTHTLTGEWYEAVVTDDFGRSRHGPFATAKEADDFAVAHWPDICFRPCDFEYRFGDPDGSYRLCRNRRLRLR